jgi:NTP pyrophosphatase (non-canonical NTP hydrolase)
MISSNGKQCPTCLKYFDPEHQWMICPHNTLGDETAPLPNLPVCAATAAAVQLELDRMTQPHEYQQKAMRTKCNMEAALARMVGCDITGTPNLAHIQFNHFLIGLIGELGELSGLWQKLIYYGKPITPMEFADRVKDEAGDLLWYIAEGLDALGLDMVEVMQANIRKLKARYPDKYSDERAADENRNRAAEAAAIKNEQELGAAALAVRDKYLAECVHDWEYSTFCVEHPAKERKCNRCGRREGV